MPRFTPIRLIQGRQPRATASPATASPSPSRDEWLAKLQKNADWAPQVPMPYAAEPTFWAQAVKEQPAVFSMLVPQLQANAAVLASARAGLLQTIEKYPKVYKQTASELLRGDPVIARRAVELDPANYEFVPPNTPGVSDDVALAKATFARDGYQYAHASPKLQSNLQLARLAVARAPTVLEHVPAALRDDRVLAYAAVSQRGDLLKLLGPKSRTDLDVVLAAVREFPPAITAADPVLQQHPQVVAAALRSPAQKQAPQSPMADALLAERSFMLAALTPAMAARVPDSLLDDPAFMREAVAVVPSLMNRAGPHVRLDPSLWLKAAARDVSWSDPNLHVEARNPGHQVLSPPPELVSNDDFTRALAAVNPRLLMGAALEDTALVVAAVRKDAGAIYALTGAQCADDQLLLECCRANPLCWSMLPQEAQQRVAALDRKASAGSEAFAAQLRELGLHHPERFRGNYELARQVISNRLSSRFDDPRPVAVVVYPKDDYNGAMSQPRDLEPLARHYRLMFYEASSDDEAIRAVRDATEAKAAEVVVLAGHGERRWLQLDEGSRVLGETERAGDPAVQDAPYLDVGDGQQLAEGLRDRIADDALLLLKSCSVGTGQNHLVNLSNTFGQVVPQANIYASRFDMMVELLFNPDGSVRRPDWWAVHSDHNPEYRIPARRSLSRAQ